VQRLLADTGAPDDLVRIAGRTAPLTPSLPPGVSPQDWEKHLTYA
jgi:hypothetical protein